MRLDFTEFTITGPVTDTTNAGTVKSDVDGAKEQNIVTLCGRVKTDCECRPD